jgi:hypothetical protein
MSKVSTPFTIKHLQIPRYEKEASPPPFLPQTIIRKVDDVKRKSGLFLSPESFSVLTIGNEDKPRTTKQQFQVTKKRAMDWYKDTLFKTWMGPTRVKMVKGDKLEDIPLTQTQLQTYILPTPFSQRTMKVLTQYVKKKIPAPTRPYIRTTKALEAFEKKKAKYNQTMGITTTMDEKESPPSEQNIKRLAWRLSSHVKEKFDGKDIRILLQKQAQKVVQKASQAGFTYL